MHRPVGDASFVDAWLPPQVGRNARLDQLHEVVDWERLAVVVSDIYAAPEGRPSYPPLLMVKVLLLQAVVPGLRPRDRGGALGPAVVPALRGTGPAGPGARPLDD